MWERSSLPHSTADRTQPPHVAATRCRRLFEGVGAQLLVLGARERVLEVVSFEVASTSSMAELFEDSALLARSASLRNFCRARASLEMSMCRSFVICFTKWAIICWSKSSPPRFVSPDVASTSKTPWSMVRRVTSKVPPPRSKTRMFRCLLPMSMMAVSWAVIRGPAAAGRAGGALGGSRAGRSQESHPPLTTADHSACKVLPGSGASHDSSANELAVSRAEEQGRPKHPGAEHDPCNRFTQTRLIQTFSDFFES